MENLGENMKKLGKYIGYIAGSIFSFASHQELARHKGSGKIKEARIDIYLDKNGKPCPCRNACAKLTLVVDSYLG